MVTEKDDSLDGPAEPEHKLPSAADEPAQDSGSAGGVYSDITGPKSLGLALLLVVFVGFGGWAAFAPIEGAAHAPGTVTVRSYKKVIQHLEGGIVEDIRVENGDHVDAGETLLVLDSTRSRAELERAEAELAVLQAREARLLAERDGLEHIKFPSHLLEGDADTLAAVESQKQIFETGKLARQGEMEILEQRIEQLESRVEGLKALRESKLTLAQSFAEELTDTRSLLDEGFAEKTRLRELERNLASLNGEAAELLSNISSTEMQIGETRLQILQRQKEFRNEVVNQLGETQTRIKDTRERINSLRDVVTRSVVKAPVAGVVNGMNVHTIGGVISPGSPIAEIVPQTEELVIEARVSPADIDRVTEGLDATIRFSSFSYQTVPTIEARVINVAADSTVDENTGNAYYRTRLEVPPEEMESLQGLTLVPGMPAEVFISTGSRTMLQYLMKPLSNVVARSFIED